MVNQPGTRTSEPPERGDALGLHPRVISTPHVAGLTREAQGRVTAIVARGLAAVLRDTFRSDG